MSIQYNNYGQVKLWYKGYVYNIYVFVVPNFIFFLQKVLIVTKSLDEFWLTRSPEESEHPFSVFFPFCPIGCFDHCDTHPMDQNINCYPDTVTIAFVFSIYNFAFLSLSILIDEVFQGVWTPI